MKHEEKIKLDNYKAHYNNIMGNIRIVNSELEKVLSLKKDGEQNLHIVKLELNQWNDTLDKVKKECSGRKEELDRKENFLNELEDKLVQKIKKYSQMENDLKEVLSKEKTKKELTIDKYVSKKERELEHIEKDLSIREQIKKDLTDIIGNLDKTKDKLEQENRQSLDNFILQSKKQEEKIKEKDRVIEQKIKELNKLQEMVKKEADKVKLPSQLLEEREVELKRKERNFHILTLRWKRFFKEHFPNQELKL